VSQSLRQWTDEAYDNMQALRTAAWKDDFEGVDAVLEQLSHEELEEVVYFMLMGY